MVTNCNRWDVACIVTVYHGSIVAKTSSQSVDQYLSGPQAAQLPTGTVPFTTQPPTKVHIQIREASKSSKIIAAPFSATPYTVALRCADTCVGNTLASTTRRFAAPRTRSRASTTPAHNHTSNFTLLEVRYKKKKDLPPTSGLPIIAVATGWSTLEKPCRIHAPQSASLPPSPGSGTTSSPGDTSPVIRALKRNARVSVVVSKCWMKSDGM